MEEFEGDFSAIPVTTKSACSCPLMRVRVLPMGSASPKYLRAWSSVRTMELLWENTEEGVPTSRGKEKAWKKDLSTCVIFSLKSFPSVLMVT